MSRPDAVIGGRYRLVSPIATGGMGTVWEAWDERLQRRVAVKQLHAQPGLSAADTRVAGERALREARNAARLHHPNAVPVYDVVDHEGQPCLVLQYLPAPSLQTLLAERGTLDVAQVARIGSEIASALEAAHQVGIVHRDVKPGNVLIDSEGRALLTDFGISQARGDASLTSTGIVTGTPAYLAPEVARGATASPASDVFSLGALLYTAVEGTSPFGDGQNAMATLHRAASGQIAPPQRSGPLTPLLQRMLAVDPRARPPMGEVAHALRDLHRRLLDPAAFAATQRMAPPPRPSAAGPPPSSTVVLPPVGGLPVSGLPVAGAPGGRPEPERRRNHGLLIAGIIIAALILGGLAALIASQAGGNGGGGASSPAVPPKTAPARHSTSAPSHHRSSSTHSSSSAPSTPPSTNQPSSPSTASTPTGGGTSSSPAAAVTNYYGLLPGNTDAGWNLLTKHFQKTKAGGRDSYDQYWGSIESVTATNAQNTGAKSAEAVITYHYKDGRTVAERTAFDFKDQGGVLKIDNTQIVS